MAPVMRVVTHRSSNSAHLLRISRGRTVSGCGGSPWWGSSVALCHLASGVAPRRYQRFHVDIARAMVYYYLLAREG
jgi:hypothetical protein